MGECVHLIESASFFQKKQKNVYRMRMDEFLVHEEERFFAKKRIQKVKIHLYKNKFQRWAGGESHRKGMVLICE